VRLKPLGFKIQGSKDSRMCVTMTQTSHRLAVCLQQVLVPHAAQVHSLGLNP
jgi:hypothetical protein